jgi:hypothetical protein
VLSHLVLLLTGGTTSRCVVPEMVLMVPGIPGFLDCGAK